MSPASSRPQPLAWAGVAERPRSVPAGTSRLIRAGTGAGPPGAVFSRRAGRRGRRGRRDPGQGVASLGQVGQRQRPQPVQGPGYSGLVQPGRDRVEVRLGGQHVGGVQFPPGQARVAGRLPAGLHPLPVPPGPLPAGGDGLGAELHLQGGGLAGQLLLAQVRCVPGEDLIRHGGVGGIKAAGVAGDPPGPAGVDQPGGHPGQGAGQPGSQVDGVVDQVTGLRAGGDQLDGQFLTGEPARRAPGRHPARQRVLERGPAAPAELSGRQDLLVLLPRHQPLRRAQHPGQLAVGQAAHVADGLLGQRGQERGRRHHIGDPVLGEQRPRRAAGRDAGAIQLPIPWLPFVNGPRLGLGNAPGGGLPVRPRHVRRPLRVGIYQAAVHRAVWPRAGTSRPVVVSVTHSPALLSGGHSREA